MSITLNLKPEIEAGLLAQAQATGMTLEGYLQHLVEKEASPEAIETGQQEGSGMVWEDGLLIYGAGTPLPAGFIENAIQHSRQDRSRHTDASAPDVSAGRMPEPDKEKQWLRAHGQKYIGQWVALNGEELLSHGADARGVRDEARAKGVQNPLMVHIPDEPNSPSAFWA